ncbi:dormancy-associated protein 2 [Folsomia candida]|uniref:Uncharacterized protein n=1 Tax=Folsomia candida TaxID=158441 RepID=A0A226EKY9_FOLCA|nr:dormancy-associated protein 2 [Folsomia candida]OXA58365.1 hypothetical protein Fcan01_06702 [Folsomia candida]
MNKIVILFGVLVALIAVQAAPPPQAAAHDVEDESEDVGLELTGDAVVEIEGGRAKRSAEPQWGNYGGYGSYGGYGGGRGYYGGGGYGRGYGGGYGHHHRGGHHRGGFYG